MQYMDTDSCNTGTYPLTNFVFVVWAFILKPSTGRGVLHSDWLDSGRAWCVSVLMKISKCAVSLCPVRQRRCRGQSQRSREGGVSGPECHCPRKLPTTLEATGPRHVEPLSPWLTYTPPPRSCARRFATPAGSEEHRAAHSDPVEATLLQGSVRLRSSWPEQQNKIRHGFSQSWLRQEQRTEDW